jgi:transcription-repair coupling factor (superfamily II helicase)
VRGGIIDVFPSTADVPVRIDLWGDEVDRLTAFAVNDQRSSIDLDVGGVLRLPGAPPHRRDVGPLPADSLRSQPWGAAQWERLAEGESFDGMESWLPYVHPDEDLLPDLLTPGLAGGARRAPTHPGPGGPAPRRRGGVGRDAGLTWGAEDEGRPGLPPTPPALRAAACRTSKAGVLALPSAGRAGTPAMTVRGFTPVAGDPARLAAR